MSDSYVPGASQVVPPSDVTDNDRLMAALSYVFMGLVSLIVLLTESGKTRAFQRYHAIQSLGLAVAAIVFEVLYCICSFILTAVTGGLLGCILWIFAFLPWVPGLYYAYQAYQGKMFEIPVLTQFMRQQKWL